MGKLELAARARAAADDARTVSAAEGVAKKGGAKQDEPSGLVRAFARASGRICLSGSISLFSSFRSFIAL